MTKAVNRQKFIPKYGQVYQNAGGGTYKCVGAYDDNYSAKFQNVASGWTLHAHGVGIYEDGSIDWDYSTGGHFSE